MLSLLQFNLPVLAVAMLIGIATARWMFRHPAPPGRNDKSLP